MTTQISYKCDGGCGESRPGAARNVSPRGWFRVEVELVPHEDGGEQMQNLTLHLCGQCAANRYLLDVVRQAGMKC